MTPAPLCGYFLWIFCDSNRLFYFFFFYSGYWILLYILLALGIRLVCLLYDIHRLMRLFLKLVIILFDWFWPLPLVIGTVFAFAQWRRENALKISTETISWQFYLSLIVDGYSLSLCRLCVITFLGNSLKLSRHVFLRETSIRLKILSLAIRFLNLHFFLFISSAFSLIVDPDLFVPSIRLCLLSFFVVKFTLFISFWFLGFQQFQQILFWVSAKTFSLLNTRNLRGWERKPFVWIWKMIIGYRHFSVIILNWLNCRFLVLNMLVYCWLPCFKTRCSLSLYINSWRLQRSIRQFGMFIRLIFSNNLFLYLREGRRYFSRNVSIFRWLRNIIGPSCVPITSIVWIYIPKICACSSESMLQYLP